MGDQQWVGAVESTREGVDSLNELKSGFTPRWTLKEWRISEAIQAVPIIGVDVVPAASLPIAKIKLAQAPIDVGGKCRYLADHASKALCSSAG